MGSPSVRHCTPWWMDGRKPLPPEFLPGARDAAAGGQHDEPRQIIVLRAEAVGDPATEGGPAGAGATRLHQHLRGGVVELFGVDGFQERRVIDDFGEVGKEVRYVLAALAVAGKLGLWPQHHRGALDKGKTLTRQ